MNWEDVLNEIKQIVLENEALRQKVKQLELEVDSLNDDKDNLIYELKQYKLTGGTVTCQH